MMYNEEIVFNGGINNLIAPHLIGQDQAQYIGNAEISSGQLKSAKEPTEETGITYGGDYAVYYKAQDEVVASTEDRFYVEWSGYLYWSNSAGVLKRYDGTTINNLGGHTAPTVVPGAVVPATTGLLNGSYVYCYTYLHDDTFESAESPIIATAVTPANNTVNITFTDTPPASATHRLLYRSGGLNPTFNKVSQIAIATTTYTDNTSDFSISREELTTSTNDAPPANIDMLIEVGGTLFGAVGNQIHFSKEGQPEYWSAYNYVEVPTDVTGLGVVGNSVIAFTEENMFVISGRNITDISITKLPYEYGCKDKRSVKSLKGRLVWLSALDEYDLLCSFDGAGVEILNLTNLQITSSASGNYQYSSFTTETYADFTLAVNYAIGIGRKYYLFLTGRTIIVDFESNVKTYYMEEEVEGAYEKNNQLYVIKSGAVYSYLPQTSVYRDVVYTTREISNGHLTREKAYRKIHVNAKGTWSIDVNVDGHNVFTFDNSMGSTIHFPSDVHGKLISFNISSTGYMVLKAINYEYDVLEYGYNTVS